MIERIKDKIKNFTQMKKSSASIHNAENWENRISMNYPVEGFKSLSNVSNYLDGNSHIDPKSICQETEIERYIKKDIMPLPLTEDREGYMGERHFEYWLFGLSDYLKIKNGQLFFGWSDSNLKEYHSSNNSHFTKIAEKATNRAGKVCFPSTQRKESGWHYGQPKWTFGK